MNPGRRWCLFQLRGPWLALCLGVLLFGCSDPSASGTKTNFLTACGSNADCSGEASCICGLCTRSCDDEADCSPGICAPPLTTNAECGAGARLSANERLCLPAERAQCSEIDVPVDNDLGLREPMTCAIPGALLCESFDRVSLEEHSIWRSGDQTATLQDCEVVNGTGALRLTSRAGGFSQLRMQFPEAVPSGAIYVRFFVQLSSASVLPEQYIILELWDLDDGSEDRTTLYLDGNGALEAYVGPEAYTAYSNGAALPRDQWVCLELALNLDDAAGSIAVSTDSTEVLREEGIDPTPANPMRLVVIESLPNGTEDSIDVDLLVDEVVVDTQPIGCAL